MDTIITAFLSSLSTVGLISAAIFVSRNWLFERLKASIKHEYDVKLEHVKSQVNRRENAYEELINALYNMVRYFNVHKEDYGQGTGLSLDQESELSRSFIAGAEVIRRATDIGAFFISDSAVNILKDLREREQLDYFNEPKFEFFAHEYEHHQKALEQLMKIAKKDVNRTN